MTFADVTAFEYLDAIERLKPASLTDFPGLKAFLARFNALPNIAPFLAARTRP